MGQRSGAALLGFSGVYLPPPIQGKPLRSPVVVGPRQLTHVSLSFLSVFFWSGINQSLTLTDLGFQAGVKAKTCVTMTQERT